MLVLMLMKPALYHFVVINKIRQSIHKDLFQASWAPATAGNDKGRASPSTADRIPKVKENCQDSSLRGGTSSRRSNPEKPQFPWIASPPTAARNDVGRNMSGGASPR